MLFAAWVSVPVFFWVAYYLFTKGRLTRHVGFLYFVIFFFSVYLGSLTIYLRDGGSNNKYLMSVMACPILSLAGMVAATVGARRVYFRNVRIIPRRPDVTLVVSTVAAFLAVYAVYLYFLGSNVPLFVLLLSGDAAEGRVARYIATKDYLETLGGVGALEWFPRILIDYFLGFVLAFAYFHLRRRALDYALFGALLAGAFLLAIMDTQKYPAVKLFVVFAICIYNSKFTKVTLRSVLPGAMVVVVVTLMGGVVYGIVSGQIDKLIEGGIVESVETSVEFGVDLMTTRGIEGQSMALYLIYALVPKTYDFFIGQTLVNPRQLLPYKPVAFPYLVCEHYKPESVGAAVRCSAPTVFFGEVYANFGVAISWLTMFAFGLLLQVINSRLAENVRSDPAPFNIAFFYLIMVYLGDYAISFITPYFDERLWFFAALLLARRLISRPVRRMMPRETVAT